MKGQKKLKASERLDLIEKGLAPITETVNATARRTGEMELIIYNLSRENEILKDALQLIHEKLDAVIDLSKNGTELSQENINSTVVSIKENNLKERVDTQIKEGNIKLIDEVDGNSFVVARELNKEGEVVNPRLQFVMNRLVEELQNKFIGKKTGELMVGEEENSLDIEIIEIYELIEKEEAPEEIVEEIASEETKG